MSDLDQYRELVNEVRSHLARYGDRRWAPRLEGWLSELDDVEKAGSRQVLIAHVQRMRKALGGMGSIGDIVICPEAGYSISDSEKDIQRANQQLLSLVRSLDKCISRILRESA